MFDHTGALADTGEASGRTVLLTMLRILGFVNRCEENR